MNIKQAIAALDPTNDDQWTVDGLPRVEAVAALVGGEVNRRQITDADPTFVRPQASGTPPPVGHPPEGEPDPATPTPEQPAEAEPDAPAKPAEGEPSGQDPEPNAPGAPDPAESPLPSEEDPAKAAYVEALDCVVAMSERDVIGDFELIERAIAEFARQAAILSARKDRIEAKLKDLGRRSALWQRALNRLPKGAGTSSREAIARYLEAQRSARAQRASRAQRFIESGTTAEDVKEQLAGPSKIDAAMKQRKPSRGAARPSYPQTVGSM